MKNPHAYIKTNIEGFANLLEGAALQNINKIIYASSSSVYGISDTLPLIESFSTDHPISVYAATKKSNELLAHAYSEIYGIDLIGLRYFTVYGPMGRPDMALWTFTESILNQTPIYLFGHGKLKRDFTYIDDAVNLTLAISEKNVKGSNVYNVGSDRPINIANFLRSLEKIIGKKAKIKYTEVQRGDVNFTHASNDKLLSEISKFEFTKLDFGLKCWFDWYKCYIDN